jgi:MFS family permease
MNKDSIWFSLRNEKFRTLWLATLMSSGAVAAYNTAAVWLMNSLARSSFFLSLIPVVTSLAFLLFTLPAGTIADQITRAKAISLINLNLALLCFCFGFIAWLGWINPGVLLFGVFF